MKKLSNNKYSGTRFQAIPKHPGTYPFAEGNKVSVDELPDRIPAYNTQGKEYKRHLPPMRDPKQIDVRKLANLINKRAFGNAEVTPYGLRLNQNEIKISEGLATCDEVCFRFTDLWNLLLELKKERILHCEHEDLRMIKNEYYKQ